MANKKNYTIATPTAKPTSISSQTSTTQAAADTAANTTASTTAAAAGSETQQTTEAPAGLKPIRQTLVGSGIANNRIGWNDKTGSVTIDGTDTYKPTTNIDGTTYAPESDINKMTTQAYKQSGNPLEWSRGYVESKLGAGAVDWDGENVNIGGRQIKPAYVQDGHAYVDKATLDQVIEDVNEQNEVKGNQSVVDNYRNASEDTLSGALDALLKRKQFSYNSDTDEGFQQLRALRESEAENAMKSALARTGSSVANASAQTLADGRTRADAIMNQLAEELYNYRQAAREGYDTDTQTLRTNLSDAQALFNDFYNKDYQANRDAVEDRNTAQMNEHTIQQDDIQNQRDDLNDAADRALTEAEVRGKDAATAGQYAQNEGYGLENANQSLVNDYQSELNRAYKSANAYDEAVRRGGYIVGDEAALPWLSNYSTDSAGYYVDANGNRLDPMLTAALYEGKKNYYSSGGSTKGSTDATNGVFSFPSLYQ